MGNINTLPDMLYADVANRMNSLYSVLDNEGRKYINGLEKEHGCNIVARWIANGELDMVCVTSEDCNTYYFQRGDKRGCDKVIINNKTLEIQVIRDC